jgi:ferredoxin--NADP+ reductase
MTCGCGRSPDSCRGWHSLSEEEYKIEYKKEFGNLKKQNNLLTVTEVHHWTDKLFSFRTEKPEGYKYKAGQFTMVGLNGIKRAYSYTSAPEDDFLEFYSIKVPNGPLTSQLKKILPGDKIEVSDRPSGTLVLDNLKPADGARLWLMATGTGIAPFISIMRDSATYEKFPDLRVTWTVRTPDELKAYSEFIDTCADFYPTVTQDNTYEGFKGRVQLLMEDGPVLKDHDTEIDRVMLCGSLAFNNDIKKILENNQFVEGTNKQPGTFVTEKAFVG